MAVSKSSTFDCTAARRYQALDVFPFGDFAGLGGRLEGDAESRNFGSGTVTRSQARFKYALQLAGLSGSWLMTSS